LQELQVPTRRLAVEVFTDGGERLAGGLFIAHSRYRMDAVELLLGVLNDERSFLPFDGAPSSSSPCSILSKAHITRVSVARNFGSAEPEVPVDHTCRLRLTDGRSLEGHLGIDTPPSLARPLDKLNRAGRFVRFVTDSTIELVQTAAIVRVE
jgi:hypothetical protein